MAEDVPNDLGAAIAHEEEARGGYLPAGVAKLPADLQPLDVAVELDVADFDRAAAIVQVDHAEVLAREFGQPDVGQRSLARGAAQRIKRAVLQSRLPPQAPAVADARQRRRG